MHCFAEETREASSSANDIKSGDLLTGGKDKTILSPDERKDSDTKDAAAAGSPQEKGETVNAREDGGNPFENTDANPSGVSDGAGSLKPGSDTRDAGSAAPSKPADPPAPTAEQLKKRNEAFGKAAQSMAKKQYDDAIKAFDAAWKSGGDNGEALIYMGACYYSKRQYPQALKQYQLASVKGTDFKTRHKAEGMAAKLAMYMRGVCPDTCLKASTPGWQYRDVNGRPSNKLWMHFRYSSSNGTGTVAYTQGHIGEKIGTVNGVPKSIGKCPTCGGTGRVSLPK